MTVQPSVPKSVPSAVEFSAANSVAVLTQPQLGPYKPATGNGTMPVVPRTDTGTPPPSPRFTGGYASPAPSQLAGGRGAPSVPIDGFLFKAQPVDAHYRNETETRNPYATTGRPGTRGWNTRVQSFDNHIAYSQHTTNTGFKVNGPQQRTSVMLTQLPPAGDFAVSMPAPQQQPQAVPYNRIRPSRGTDRYGTGVLNSDTYGAGQTAGGVGGSNYTPSPGPPPVNTVTASAVSGEVTWG